MPVRTARRAQFRSLSCAVPRVTVAAFVLIIGSTQTHNAVANGDTRTISFHHLHTGEDLTVTYKVRGRYDAAALKKIDWLMRDWRKNEAVKMDPHLIDVLWEVHRETGGGVIKVVCGYRAPATNSMLRRRSRGVAQNSQHTHGKAIDFYIEGADLSKLREAGLRLQRGGVGFYPGSGWPFVHMDVGSIRHWPRMSHDQLARVFPDGRTVHIPSDGQPLKNYALALADVQKRGDAPSALYAQAARDAGVATTGKRTTLASLFGFGKKKDGDENEEADVPAAAAPAAPAEAAKPQPARPVQLAAIIPLPKTRPDLPVPAQATYQVASAAPIRAEAPARLAPVPLYNLAAAVTPNDVIAARGYWRGQPQPQQTAEASAVRRDTAAPQRQATTGSVGPNIGPWTREPPPGEVAIAYASADAPQADPRTARAAPMGQAMPRAAAGTTVAHKSAGADRPSLIQTAFAALPPRPASSAVTGRAFDEPWLRAIIATPSVQAFMNTSLYGATDYTALRPLMAQPSHAVIMAFTADPGGGMAYHQFSGAAVVFLATTRTIQRTASLR